MSRIPKYQQIEDWIHGRIESGELHAGDRIETEAELCGRFGFSRQTVRQALSNLEKEGLLSRVQGSGSYISSTRTQRSSVSLSRSVTIISSYTDSYIFPRILQAMSSTLQKSGYSTRIMFTNNHRETERSILRELLDSDSRDPLIVEPVTSALPNPSLDMYREMRQRGIPILFFNTFYPELDIPHVSLDDDAVGRMAAQHLISLGHRKIGCIFKSDDGEGLRRYRGYQEALIGAGIPVEEKNEAWVDTQMLSGPPEESEWILKRLSDCTACVCYNDEAAYMLTELCSAHQIRVPQDLAIASVDNSRLSELSRVPLTSVQHPMEELGVRTAENLLRLIRDPGFQATYEFSPKLTVRASSAG